jgi:hypothetical protein
VDAAAALADLLEISSQVEQAVALDDHGGVLAATAASDAQVAALAAGATRLLEAADFVRPGQVVTEVAVLTSGGSVVVARAEGRTVAARLPADPTVGLALYDLRTCVRALAEEPEGAEAGAPA